MRFSAVLPVVLLLAFAGCEATERLRMEASMESPIDEQCVQDFAIEKVRGDPYYFSITSISVRSKTTRSAAATYLPEGEFEYLFEFSLPPDSGYVGLAYVSESFLPPSDAVKRGLKRLAADLGDQCNILLKEREI